jgi:ribosome biogenesis protein BMS1
MFPKGQYVCITLEGVPYNTYQRFNYAKPMILARINLGEDNYGFLNVKFKRHRWYSNLLKSNDPIIVSSGWRRYQSMIVFATQDDNDRMRYLKYTPKHDFCNAVFWGNFVQQNTGVVLQQTIRNDLKKFRISGTGLVMEINKSFEIMKKIKLIGEPYKIMKNTAFVKGMFNSSMEVSNYIGAQIRTVSGIRGQVKKAIKDGG